MEKKSLFDFQPQTPEQPREEKPQLKIYTPEEVAAFLKVTKLTIYNYIRSGKLNAVKRGGKWYITNKDIDRFLEIN